MTTLTNTAIDALLPGEEIKDDRVPGLSVRAHATGKSFMLYYRTKDGQTRRPKIGTWGVTTLAKAREVARDTLSDVQAGRDPVAERVKRRGEPTIAGLWARVELKRYNSGRTWDKEAARLYAAHIAPRLVRRRAVEIGYDDALALHRALERHPVAANRTLSVLSTMLTEAERYGMRPPGSNPCRLVQRYPEHNRKRYAKPVEIKALGPILQRYAVKPRNRPAIAFLYLLMFSGARPSEIGNATPAMLERIEKDGRVFGVLRLPQAKTGARDVFLPPQALAVLDALPPGRTTLAGRRSMPKELWGRIRAEAGCPDLWARDWRRTFATVGLSDGLTLDALGELLGHRSRQTTMIYAKLMDDPALAAAAGIAGRVEEMLNGSD